MNPLPKKAYTLMQELSEAAGNNTSDCELWVAPPAIYLKDAVTSLQNSGIKVGVQNIYPETTGAYTGEISAEMAVQMGAEFAIVGHSERRAYFGETNEFLLKKVMKAMEAGLTAVYCCGENLEERESGAHFDIVKKQIEEVILMLPVIDVNKLLVAYEPVWAIGTGKTATPDQAQEMHAFIRQTIAAKDQQAADQISILYGGSCKPGNATELFSNTDVDGGLIGGASLNAMDFIAISNSF